MSLIAVSRLEHFAQPETIKTEPKTNSSVKRLFSTGLFLIIRESLISWASESREDGNISTNFESEKWYSQFYKSNSRRSNSGIQ